MKFRSGGETLKIVVMSDSHGCNEELEYVINKEKNTDLWLHCGDICVPSHIYNKVVVVRGNNDLYNYPIERIINVPGHRILMLHSHTLPFMAREEALLQRAEENKCDIVLFGHTHIPYLKKVNGVTLLNPGSLYHNRDGSDISYAVLRVDEAFLDAKIKYIEEEVSQPDPLDWIRKHTNR